MTPSETRAVLMDLIEKAKACRDTCSSDQDVYWKAVFEWGDAQRDADWPMLLALALKGLDAEEQIEFIKHDIAEREP